MICEMMEFRTGGDANSVPKFLLTTAPRIKSAEKSEPYIGGEGGIDYSRTSPAPLRAAASPRRSPTFVFVAGFAVSPLRGALRRSVERRVRI